MSSAHGYGQFIDDTWTRAINNFGVKYGVPNAGNLTKNQAAAYRTNLDVQAGMLAEFTRQNIAVGRELGGPDDDANVYALHNLGENDGGDFLRRLRENQSTKVSKVLTKAVIERNAVLYGDGSITLMQAYQRMGAVMRQGEQFAIDARKLEK